MSSLSSARLTTIFVIAFFAVLSHWGVWEKGVLSMGWNTSIFWLALGGLLLRFNERIDVRRDWPWIVPLSLMALSFGLYENPWLKAISFIVMPVSVGVFFSYGHVIDKHEKSWGASLLLTMISNALSVVPATPSSVSAIRNVCLSGFKTDEQGSSEQLELLKRIMRALIILMPLLFVILLLLSSADENFDLMVSGWFNYLAGVFNWSIAAKGFCILILCCVLNAVIQTLRQPLIVDADVKERKVDDVVACIVLSAILFVYIAFLNLQLEYVLVKSLPIEFSDTERLVKSGFWQLFFLSMINVGLFYWVYKNAGLLAQWILRFYILASALILLSAGWRMGLYVYHYGFSYEKFFASYTTIYALLLFVFLGCAAFASLRKDIVKFVCISSLWMFSLVTVLPIERIIFFTNVSLSKQQGSRIDLFHLTDLSADILSPALKSPTLNRHAWNAWFRSKIGDDCNRSWFETNLSLEMNCANISLDDLPTSIWTFD